MKKLLLFSVLLVFACSKDDNDSSQQFRKIYSNTFWQSGEGLISFSPDKLFYSYVPNKSGNGTGNDGTFYEEGSFNNVRLNDCTFGNITYIVIDEDNDTLSLRSVHSNGTGNSPCTNEEINVVFQILNENVMEFTLSDANGYSETLTLVRANNSFSTNDCVNATLNGQAWW